MLGRRLSARDRPLGEAAKMLVAAAVRFLETAELEPIVRPLWGRHHAGWIFAIREMMKEARGKLVTVLGSSTSRTSRTKSL
jgi:hypothetical protein